MKKPTLQQFLPKYKAHARANLKPRTFEEYARIIDKILIPSFGTRRLHNLTTHEIEQWHLKKRKTAPVQANRALAVLSAILTLAARWGYVPVNPAKGVSRAPERERRKYFTKDEIHRIKAALAEFKLIEQAFVLAALYTGARPGELLSAAHEHITDGRLELPDSKTGRRTVYLPEPAQEAISAAGRASGPLFPGVQPTALWRRLRRRAGLTDARLYDLRHTFASNGLQAGYGLDVIGLLLGHRKAQTTLRYAHLQTEVGTEAAGKIADLL